MIPRPIHPPQPIPDFLDNLRAEGKRIVPGTAQWLEYEPGKWVVAVIVENAAPSARLHMKREAK